MGARATPYLYVAPTLAFLAAFMAYPLTQTVVKSFYAYDLTNPIQTFVGWANYAAAYQTMHLKPTKTM